MTAVGCREIGALVLRVQSAFLDAPNLALTPPAARRRFGLDEVTCDAVLSALAESAVLARTRDGAYVRHFPHQADVHAA